MDRLIFNTPTRMGGGGDDSSTFIAFTIFFLAFLALLWLGFLVWYLLAPQSSHAFLAKLRVAASSQLESEDQMERAILFSDPVEPQ